MARRSEVNRQRWLAGPSLPQTPLPDHVDDLIEPREHRGGLFRRETAVKKTLEVSPGRLKQPSVSGAGTESRIVAIADVDLTEQAAAPLESSVN